MKKWSETELNLAIELCNNGYNYDEIAEKINRTKKSVKIKLNKLNFYIKHNINYVEIICENCEKVFKANKNDKRKFCSKSCSAIKNNKLYPKRIKLNENKRKSYNERQRKSYEKRKNKFCLNCNTITTNKFCNSKCQNEYRKKEIFKKIENGDNSLYHKQYKKYLINKFGEKCMKCGWDERHLTTGNVPIELEHIDGNSNNNNLNNLQLLCPNCHSLTSTYKSLNVGNGRYSRRLRYYNDKSY